jgi:hypothetical protein
MIKSGKTRLVSYVKRLNEIKFLKFLVGKPEGKRKLGRYRHRWKWVLAGCGVDSSGSG